MKNIAFKRAKSADQVKDSLHPEFIVEHADTTLFNEGFHQPSDGYEILSEDMFIQELSKNEGLQSEFLSKKRDEEILRQKIEEAEDQARKAEDRKAQREYQEFLRWKKNKGK